MVPCALAQVLEQVFAAVELGSHHMRHPLAAHLRIATGFAVHPPRHDVATDARCGLRPLGQLGRGVMRAARTEIWRAFCPRYIQQDRRLFSQRARLLRQVFIREERVQPLGHHGHQRQRA